MTQLPAGWEVAKIGDLVASIDAGKSLSGGGPAKPGEIGVIKVSAMTWGAFRPEENKALPPGTVIDPQWTVRAGDLLFSRANTSAYVGACVQVAEDHPHLILSDKSLRLTPSSGVVSTWLMYALRAEGSRKQIEELASGTKDSMRNISQEKLRSIRTPLPPTAEQQRIVAAIEEAFSLLDAGETALHNTRTRLKRMRDSVLTAAVTGQLVPQDPTDTPADKLLADLGVGSLTDSPAELPESWSWVALGDVTGIGGGIQKQPKRRPAENPVPFLRVANVGRGSLDLAEIHDIEVFDGELDRYGLWAGDLLVVEGNGSPDQIGRAAVWGGQIAPCVHQNHLIRVRPGPALNADYLGMYWNSPTASARVQAVASSTSGLHTLSTGKLRGLPVALPPIEEQARIVAEVERQSSFIEAAERAVDVGLTRSGGLRRSVLKAAFEGRLVVQDPADEPAAVLLERIAAERAVSPKGRAPRRARGKAEAS